MNRIIVFGSGGFIGSHLAKRLKQEGNYVIGVDIVPNKYMQPDEFCNEFILADLRDPAQVEKVIPYDIDEAYQLAADMGGSLYIFSGVNDASVIYNSAIINLNIAREAVNKKIKKLFFSSSACIYPSHNQEDPNNPNCKEDSAFPANCDSSYGWEKLFSEIMYDAFRRNLGLNVRIARFHNIFGKEGCWRGGKEKAPAALLRKVCETPDGGEIEIWGDGKQTRSFLYIDECVEAVLRLMASDCTDVLNIGSEEMVSINTLAEWCIKLSGKNLTIKNIYGDEYFAKYGTKCPTGVRGRNSDNTLYRERIGWCVSEPLIKGLEKTYGWIKEQVDASRNAME